MAKGKFLQPVDGIEIVSRASDTPEITEGRRRIAAGEDIDQVALDLVIQEMASEGIGSLKTAAHRETAVHGAADAHLGQIQTAIYRAFQAGRGAYKSGGRSAAVSAVRQSLLDHLPAVLLRTVVAGAEAAISMLPQKRVAESRALAGPKVTMKFDQGDPIAAQWAREHAAELAKGIGETTEQAIKDAIAEEQETGEDAYDAILAAVGDEARAELIARTESMMAANEGQREAWDQAVEEGLLPEDAQKMWIAAADPCPECDELDGEVVGLDEEYSGDGGDGPPLHPNCRCTEGIVGF